MAGIRIELREYSSVRVELDEERLDAVISAADGRLTVRRVTGGYELSAGPHVGVIVAGDVTIVVQPKVPLHNLFLMLGVRIPRLTDPTRFGTDTDLLSAMAEVFVHEVRSATSRGILHAYTDTRERLISPRGRIDITEQIRRPAMPSPIACRFDEFTNDVFENRTLVAALDVLRSVPGVDPGLRSRIGGVARRFDGVRRTATDPRMIDQWSPTRLNGHYTTAMRLAGIVLRRLSLRNVDGTVDAPSFTVDMNRLFQDFVADRLTRALGRRLDLVAEPRVPLVVGNRLGMFPDLVFRYPAPDLDPGPDRYAHVAYVGDVKYKLSSGRARMGDYHQLLAYTTVMDLDDGVLIYAQQPDPAEPSTAATDPGLYDIERDDPDRLVHSIRVDNSSKTLHVYRLPLTGSNEDVEAGIRDLAEWIAGRSSYRTTPLRLVV